eukprot:SM000505S17661  [mRNA]  locus=s505:112:3996:+ [translate_table: standard]
MQHPELPIAHTAPSVDKGSHGVAVFLFVESGLRISHLAVQVVTEAFCFNQCWGNGTCDNGFCKCQGGWYGLDCSIAAGQELDNKSALLETSSSTAQGSHHLQQTHTVVRPRPLVYVYDLPGSYNSQMLQGRQSKDYCVMRQYGVSSATEYTNALYGLEVLVTEGLLASEHRTFNAGEADYFYVPVLGGCAIARADDSPRFEMEKYNMCRPWLAADIYLEAYEHIRDTYPYWNNSQGRDHIWAFGWDEGACYAPQAIWNSIMLSHWGNTGSAHPGSTTAFVYDLWDVMPASLRGNHPCYDPDKDIVLPAWKSPSFLQPSLRLWERPVLERTNLFYFAGNLGFRYHDGRPEKDYSMGIRQKVARLFGSTPDKDGLLGLLAEAGVVVLNGHAEDYSQGLSASRFCGVFPGDGFSARMEDAILHGCIPVIVQDGIHLPYENFLDYSSFTVRIAEEDICKLVTILKAYSDEEVEQMWGVVQNVWQRWSWHSVLHFETERQLALARPSDHWIDELDILSNDDALSTLFQILHYKLYHDRWRVDARYKHGWGPMFDSLLKWLFPAMQA